MDKLYSYGALRMTIGEGRYVNAAQVDNVQGMEGKWNSPLLDAEWGIVPSSDRTLG
jgi:hypothetical protein